MNAGHTQFGRFASLIVFGASLSLAACGDDSDNPGPVGPGPSEPGAEVLCLAVAGSDAETGAISIVDLTTNAVSEDVTSIHNDAVLYPAGDTLLVVNRFGADNLQALDIKGGMRTLWQYSAGQNTNPAFIATQGDKGFLVLYGSSAILEVNLAAESEADFVTGSSISIPPAAEWDGAAAEIGNAIVHEGTLFVMTQGLGDDWICAEGAHGRIYAFDAATLEPVNAFGDSSVLDLATCNGENMFIANGKLYVQTVGTYRLYTSGEPKNDGGVEVIDLESGASEGLLVDEAAVGGRDIFTIFASQARDGFWALLPGSADFNAMDLHLIGFDGSISESLYQGDIRDIVEFDGTLYLAERTPAATGLTLLDAETAEVLTDAPISVGLPPRDLAIFTAEGSCF